MFRQMFEEKYIRFPGGRKKALTFSYDDGVKADKKLVEILNANGLKGTFNLNSRLFDCECWHGRMDEEETYRTFSGQPHEVALHGARHVFLNKVPLPEAVNEILQNKVYLEGKFGRIVSGLAYAYNGYSKEIVSLLPALGVEYARTTEDTNDFSLPADFYLWRPTCHHRSAAFGGLADKFLNGSPEEEFKHREGWLFYIWGHSYEFDDDGNWETIENFARAAGAKKDIWFATNSEICRYVRAYRALAFSADGERVYNPSALPVWLELRGKVYMAPSGGEIAFLGE